MTYNLPATYLMGINDGTRRFLNSFGYSQIPTYFQIFGNVVNIMFTHYFVQTCDMGIKGIGLASGLSNLLIFIGLTIYPMLIPELKEAVKLPTSEMFNDLSHYMTMALPICFM